MAAYGTAGSIADMDGLAVIYESVGANGIIAHYGGIRYCRYRTDN